jgi:hypothetical protein
MIIGRRNRSPQRKPAPVPLCPPQISCDLSRIWARAAAVGSRRLTAWAMECPDLSLEGNFVKQEVLGRNNCRLSFDTVGTAYKTTGPTLLSLQMYLLPRQRFTEPLPANSRGIYTDPLPSLTVTFERVFYIYVVYIYIYIYIYIYTHKMILKYCRVSYGL